MLAHLSTAAIVGIDAVPVDIEVDIAAGLPQVTIVGLPDASIQEARERIRSALHNSRFTFPKTRVTINLAPADLHKAGSGFDFPIALGILVASGVIHPDQINNVCAVGELALDGTLRPVKGSLLFGMCAKKLGTMLLVPERMARQAASVPGGMVFPVSTLAQAVMHCKRIQPIKPYVPSSTQMNPNEDEYAIDEIVGQAQAKRALCIAAAGGHSMLLFGPPGAGKTMLARSIRGILPPLHDDERFEVTAIWSAAGVLDLDAGLLSERPFRAPHHSASAIALTGGGASAQPGEISLAHRGVLYLDECAEFPASVLNMLRQPLESGSITILRAERRAVYPASFQLIASTNPCPCGNSGSEGLLCTCSPAEKMKYRKRLSGPLLDRIDMVVHVPREPFVPISNSRKKETQKEFRMRVAQCHALEMTRQGCLNAKLPKKLQRSVCRVTDKADAMLSSLVNRFMLSRRAADRIVRVARTIADVDGRRDISHEDIAESAQWRVSAEELVAG